MQFGSLYRIAFAALICFSASADAQPSPRQQAAGADHPRKEVGVGSASQEAAVRLVREWLHEMETADDAAYTQFIREHVTGFPGDPDQWLEFRHRARGTRLYSVRSATPDGVDLWLFDPNMDSFVDASVKLQSSDDPKKIEITKLQLTHEVPTGTAPPPTLQGPALMKAFSARAAHYAENGDFSGAVLLAKRGHVLFEKAYGFADREARKPNQLNTQFRFGSMGKMFTMIAIMQLVQDGKVDLSAPIGRYLKGYPNQDIATKVTVANLLTHTGGTGDIFGPDFDAHKASLRDLKDYVDLYGKRAPEFVSGSRWVYSNYGFILLGRIVEEVSGLTYDDYLQRYVFGPAAMHSTGNLPESERLPHRAVAYIGYGAKLKRADSTLPVRGTSAGGGYSTVGDFKRFVDAIVSHRLLRADTLQTLISGGIKTADGEFHPYDFGATMEAEGRYIGHGGGAPGMNGELLHFLDSGYTIIVLANRDPPAADSIAMYTARRLPPK